MKRIFLLLGATALLLTMLLPAFAGAAPKKTICHVPPGNPGNAHTITVGAPAAAAHLDQHEGDYAGPCKKPGNEAKVVYALKEVKGKEKCVRIDKGDSKKYDKVYKDAKCTEEKIVYVKKDDKKNGECLPINKAKSFTYDKVYKDKECSKVLHKKH
jgi:hypothetical protein